MNHYRKLANRLVCEEAFTAATADEIDRNANQLLKSRHIIVVGEEIISVRTPPELL
jgi:hypothetical protein